MEPVDKLIYLEEKLELQMDANQKLLAFLQERELVGDFREWAQKNSGIPGWNNG